MIYLTAERAGQTDRQMHMEHQAAWPENEYLEKNVFVLRTSRAFATACIKMASSLRRRKKLVKKEENLIVRGHLAGRRRCRSLPCCCQGRPPEGPDVLADFGDLRLKAPRSLLAVATRCSISRREPF